MKVSTVLRILLTAIVTGLFVLPITQVNSHPYSQQADDDKPPEVIQGGEWVDDFLTEQWMSKNIDTELNFGHFLLKFGESLHWAQTWTAHFADGEFFQTEAISDSVRLVPNGMDQYFTTGIYTS